ncbi:MAG: ClbS/DfsB family four-helix bundle protein [Bacteroidia bacterium]|nr:ClbS/DfsB family four-helix bundle protein [Bacteroidia bacterium]
MSRPTTKQELLKASQEKYTLIIEYIGKLPDANQEFHPGTMNRNVRDVLIHLIAWHNMFLKWYEVGMKGDKPVMPCEGYSWKTTPELNKKIWSDGQGKGLKKVMKEFKDSHEAVQAIISRHTNAQLFEKQKYAWTGSTSLGSYLVSATSSHYDWAIKLIKRGLK